MERKRRFSRFRRKRRISQGTWFPILGSTWTGEDDTFHDVSFTLTTGPVPNSRDVGPQVGAVAVTRDYTPQNIGQTADIEQQPSLRDYTEGQDYILKRIVGNATAFIESNQPTNVDFNPTQYWARCKVTCGFFVARTDDNDQTLPDLTEAEIDPQDSRNSQNPWIWRRSWILANPANLEELAPNAFHNDEVVSNRDYGDNLTNSYIDARSKRRVRREQRLWFAYSCIGWDGVRASVIQSSDQPSLAVNLDIRLFGKMVKGKNNSAF